MNQVQEILKQMCDFNRPQALGVVALIFIAQREQTSVSYQWKEWGYSDIPETLVGCIDELDDDDQFAIASKIATEFAEDDLSAYIETPAA